MQMIKATEDGLCCPVDASDYTGISWQMMRPLLNGTGVVGIMADPLSD